MKEDPIRRWRKTILNVIKVLKKYSDNNNGNICGLKRNKMSTQKV